MRRYETVIIAPGDLPDDEIAGLVDRYKSIIAKQQGFVIKVEKWGKRKLAYEIRKHNRGYYLLFDFAGRNDVVAELERNLKIDDKILKFMTIQKSNSVVMEEIEKEIAAALPAEPVAGKEIKTTEPAADIQAEAAKAVETQSQAVREGGA